jgi:hypothetical protein
MHRQTPPIREYRCDGVDDQVVVRKSTTPTDVEAGCRVQTQQGDISPGQGRSTISTLYILSSPPPS